ncbi:proline-rich receptor-like protein kinase PERK2 [Hordeum vulgare subsp. vulgare]|uniref:proline-rich receptor-like protein kinase PERK2 n=1 Tax=Hordeum vulgare subsp. vulgare TaxID=112509 RepID=UPI001D1A32CD|nr:proline-rich receptor-like protein kinase PERK2 [Hordeum vulgare subsp. vulgare]
MDSFEDLNPHMPGRDLVGARRSYGLPYVDLIATWAVWIGLRHEILCPPHIFHPPPASFLPLFSFLPPPVLCPPIASPHGAHHSAHGLLRALLLPYTPLPSHPIPSHQQKGEKNTREGDPPQPSQSFLTSPAGPYVVPRLLLPQPRPYSLPPHLPTPPNPPLSPTPWHTETTSSTRRSPTLTSNPSTAWSLRTSARDPRAPRPPSMAGMASEGSQFDTKNYDSEMKELLHRKVRDAIGAGLVPLSRMTMEVPALTMALK